MFSGTPALFAEKNSNGKNHLTILDKYSTIKGKICDMIQKPFSRTKWSIHTGETSQTNSNGAGGRSVAVDSPDSFGSSNGSCN